MRRKQYEPSAFMDASNVGDSQSSNILYNNRLKLPIPSKGDTKDGYNEIRLLFLPVPGESDTIIKKMAEVAINHIESSAFIAKYYLSEDRIDKDLAVKTKWDLYHKNAKVSNTAFKNIRLSHKEGVKRLVNVYVEKHPIPEEVGQVRIFAYGKKVAEAIDAALKGNAAYDYENPVNIMASLLRIVIPEGVQASSLYDKAKFIPADDNYIQGIYDKLNDSDLFDLDALAANKLQTGNAINPPDDYVLSLLEMAGYNPPNVVYAEKAAEGGEADVPF